ncbi:MAG: LysR family transcriptional regulator [Clostridium sp.]|uniref:LysR family transcriptional regulator n=1 Tax=Clostridium sp. TaxID=1506 RepID=UPI00290AF1D8|nr:LysR family transcriptional regulator [Clostridium sp.]MDU7338062.1 LysR family transcriptional regulator [Clostridium sp.]
MTLLQLQYFKALAQILHYTKAAKELHIAQPSLSYSINELEKELGVKLFDKENRKIRLTPYGEQFLTYVDRVLMLLDEGVQVLHQMAGSALQVVKLGYFHSISTSLIPSIMSGIYSQEENRGVRFQFLEGTSFDILSQLKKGELDLAFCMHLDEAVESLPILKQPLYLTVPSNHPLAERSFVTFEDFAQEPIVMLEKSSSLRAQMDQVYSQHSLVPNIVFEVRECNAALQYVALRFGISVLPHVPAMENEKVSVIPIADEKQAFARTVYLSWAKNRPLSPAAQRSKNYILEHYAQLQS